MRLVSVAIGLSWLCACGGRDPATLPPAAFSFNGSQPFPAVVGEAIALTPAVSSGSIDEYVVSPALPAGLVLNRVTGVISGTPTRASAASTFVITASHRGGLSTFNLVLSVTEPPSHLWYPTVEGTVGAALAPLHPKVAGTVKHYEVTPAFPAGVVLDNTTGTIAGTPSVPKALAPYTITASSQAGNTSFILLLAVAAPPPERHQ